MGRSGTARRQRVGRGHNRLSAVVLLGAEINAEAERQTERDTTRGSPVPMGERHAVAADEVADQR
jgi:hypothetical protein